ncbi:hypothetical protein SGPA1_70024 [Streptomyces misionensis JCM 4497]
MWRSAELVLASDSVATLVGAFFITERTRPLANDLPYGSHLCVSRTEFEGGMTVNKAP